MVVLIPIDAINIYGLVIASTMGYFISAVINLAKIKSECNFSLKMSELLVPLIACGAIGVVIYMFNLYTNGTVGILSAVTIVAVSAVLYFLILTLFKQLNLKELKKMLQNSIK